MNNSKTAVVLNTMIHKLQTIIGYILAVFFGLVFIINLTTPSIPGTEVASVIILIVIAAGIFLIFQGKKRKKLLQTFKNYVGILSEDPSGSLVNLAEATGTSIDVVKQNVASMIEKKYFSNALLDSLSNRIVFPERSSSLSGTPNSYIVTSKQSPVEMESFTCKGCGGINTAPKEHPAHECDYCGTIQEIV